MSRVSRQAIRMIAQAVASVKGCSFEEVFAVGPIALQEARQSGYLEDWGLFVDWLNQLDSRYFPVDWVAVGEACLCQTSSPTLRRIVRMTMSVRFSYWLSAAWFGPSQFPGIACRFEDLGPRRIRQTFSIDPNLRGCPQLFEIFAGSKQIAPQWLFGLDKAKVSNNIRSHQAIYDIELPKTRSVWIWFHQGLKSFRYLPSLFKVLAQQQSELAEQSRTIQAERGELKNLIEHFPDGILIHRNGEIVYMNSKLLSILECSDSKAYIGKSILSLVIEEERNKLSANIANTARFYQTIEFFLKPLDLNDPILVETIPIPITFEGAPAVAVAIKDLTALRKLQTQLMTDDRMRTLGQLAAGIGHEINNPLYFVSLKSKLLGEHLQRNQDQFGQKMIEEIERGLQRIEQTVKQLKSFSRGHEQERSAPVDVREALNFALQMIPNSVQDKASIITDIQAVPLISGNESKLGQVFLNLILNASQALEVSKKDSRKIWVRLFQEQDQVVVEIEDSGCGIPENVRSRIFQPFYTTKPVGEGTGLGLSICRTIISEHKGSIDFVSNVGQGTVFRVVLPLPEVELKNALPVEKRSPPISKVLPRKRVLLIDDEVELLEVLAEVMSAYHDATAVDSADKALRRIASGEKFDCIFCDLRMPEIDGPEFYRRLILLEAAYKDRIFFLTGGSTSREHSQFLAQPGIRSFEKPLDVSVLNKVVNNLDFKKDPGLREDQSQHLSY